MPFVHYAGLYSTFVRFSANENTETYLCACAQEAAKNHVVDRISCLGGSPPWSIRSLGSLIDRPTIGKMAGAPDHFTTPEEVIPHLRFADGLCHRCNKAVPSIDYGYELSFKHTSFFAQRFGFYVQQWLLSKGLTGWGDQLPGVPPSPDVEALLPINTIEARQKLSKCAISRTFPDRQYEGGLDWSEERQLRDDLKVQRLAMCAFAEEQIRRDFTFPARGKLAQAEYMLYLILCRIFGNNTVIHRSRPTWLRGLELDVHVPSAGIAAEYQGHQHSTPKSFMHDSPNSFPTLKARDARKSELCAENSTMLIYFYEDDYLTEALVRSRFGM